MPRPDTTDTLHTIDANGNASNAQLHADIMSGVTDDMAWAHAYAIAQGMSTEHADLLYPLPKKSG